MSVVGGLFATACVLFGCAFMTAVPMMEARPGDLHRRYPLLPMSLAVLAVALILAAIWTDVLS